MYFTTFSNTCLGYLATCSLPDMPYTAYALDVDALTAIYGARRGNCEDRIEGLYPCDTYTEVVTIYQDSQRKRVTAQIYTSDGTLILCNTFPHKAPIGSSRLHYAVIHLLCVAIGYGIRDEVNAICNEIVSREDLYNVLPAMIEDIGRKLPNYLLELSTVGGSDKLPYVGLNNEYTHLFFSNQLGMAQLRNIDRMLRATDLKYPDTSYSRQVYPR